MASQEQALSPLDRKKKRAVSPRVRLVAYEEPSLDPWTTFPSPSRSISWISLDGTWMEGEGREETKEKVIKPAIS